MVAGDFDFELARAAVTRRLAAYPARDGRSGAPLPAFEAYAGPVVVPSPLVDQVNVAVAIPAPPRDADNFFAFLIADQLLMGGRTGFESPSEIRRDDDAPLPRRLVQSLGASGLRDGMRYPESPPLLASRSPASLRVLFSAPPSVSGDRVQNAVSVALDDIAATTTDAEIEAAKRALLDFMSGWMLSPNLLALSDHLATFALFDDDPARLNRLPVEIMRVRPSEVRAWIANAESRIALVTPQR